MNCELIIFDCDGVLVDSEVISTRTLVSALEKKDLSAVAAEVQILERSGFPARYLVDNGRQP